MDLSVIVVSYNTKELLDRCLKSVYDSMKGSPVTFEIIVLDNGSKDGSIELLKTKYPRVIKIFSKVNTGFGKANNICVGRAKGTYVLLLNSDAMALKDAIPVLYEYTRAHSNSFVGGKLYNEDKTPQASCGPMVDIWHVFLMLFAKGDKLGLTRSSPTREKHVDWVSGACILTSKKAYLDSGAFDEGIFMYMEEIDLLYRAKKMGYDILFFPGARFIHTGAASSASHRRPVINIYRGLRYFYRKHYSSWEISLLEGFLRVKAWIAIAIGKLIHDKELVTIYAQALNLDH